MFVGKTVTNAASFMHFIDHSPLFSAFVFPGRLKHLASLISGVLGIFLLQHYAFLDDQLDPMRA